MHSKETCSQFCNKILLSLSIECQQCNKEIYTTEIHNIQSKARVKHFYTRDEQEKQQQQQ